MRPDLHHPVGQGGTTSGQYYLRATKLSGLRDKTQERGADLATLMPHAGREPAALAHPQMLLDDRNFCGLLHGCAIGWDIPDIGLRMAKAQAVNFLGPVGRVARMEFGQGVVERLALAMRVSPRSLQRQLRQEGTSFRERVDEWRRDRASCASCRRSAGGRWHSSI